MNIKTPTPDPKDPLNLPEWRKWLAVASLCFCKLLLDNLGGKPPSNDAQSAPSLLLPKSLSLVFCPCSFSSTLESIRPQLSSMPTSKATRTLLPLCHPA